MTRKLVNPSIKDDAGIYTKVAPPPPVIESEVSLAEMLDKQLLALDRVTRQLLIKSSTGEMTKAEIDSLATCIEVTMKLKHKENELLDKLTDTELKKIAHKG